MERIAEADEQEVIKDFQVKRLENSIYLIFRKFIAIFIH